MGKMKVNCVLFGLLVAVPLWGGVASTPTALHFSSDSMGFDSAVLTISGPEGFEFRKIFSAADDIKFNIPRAMGGEKKVISLKDGTYKWELRFVVLQKRLEDEAQPALEGSALTNAGTVRSGTFSVVMGSIHEVKDANDDRLEGGASATVREEKNTKATYHWPSSGSFTGNLCAGGSDCASAYSPGWDIEAIDTTPAFRLTDDTTTPTTEWFLWSDSNSLQIQDGISAGVPNVLVLEEAAPQYSLYVESTGELGFGTSTPAADLHILQQPGGTAGLRLEDDSGAYIEFGTGSGSSSIIDSNGSTSTTPFWWVHGAPTYSFYMDSSGRIGLGTSSPDRMLHVDGTSTDVRVEVTNTGAVASRSLFKIDNNGPASFAMRNAAVSDQWTFEVGNTGFAISQLGSGVQEAKFFGGGNLTIAGTLTQGSSREIKTAFAAIDGLEILEQVVQLPLSIWSYKHDAGGVRHLGPMAEDFFASFGLGRNEKGLATLDTSGVALAAIQGLRTLVGQKEAQIQALTDSNTKLEQHSAELEARIERLEAAIESLTE